MTRARRQLTLLDTNIIGFVIRGESAEADRRLAAAPPGSLHMSVITRAELRFGVRRKPGATRLAALVDAFLARVPALPWTDETADAYGDLRATLERRGRPIGNLDLMIAAHALALDALLVTNNRRHFEGIPGLRIEDWTRASGARR